MSHVTLQASEAFSGGLAVGELYGPRGRKQQFRAYRMSPWGHIASVEIIEAKDDDHAIKALNDIERDCPIEVWDEGRFVGRVEASRAHKPPRP